MNSLEIPASGYPSLWQVKCLTFPGRPQSADRAFRKEHGNGRSQQEQDEEEELANLVQGQGGGIVHCRFLQDPRLSAVLK